MHYYRLCDFPYRNNKVLFAIGLFILYCFGVNLIINDYSQNDPYDYTGLSRLTDPEDNADILSSLPTDINEICDIANKQLVHYRMMAQWKIRKSEWNTARANHDIKNILDSLKNNGSGNLSIDRKLENRVLGACTKESIFLTSLLRHKNISARIRVGYLTNLYKGAKAVAFWQNVNQYERNKPLDPKLFDSFTLHNADVNRSIEHWVTEYYDNEDQKWKILDARPEYLESHGVELENAYQLKEDENFEFAWQVWLRRHEPIEEDAYAERGWDARTHIRYQLLMDFYSLLNHEAPAIFEDNGVQTDRKDERRKFVEKSFESLSDDELDELDELADLLSKNPDAKDLIYFYNNCKTLKIKSIEEDPYSFIYIDRNMKTDS